MFGRAHSHAGILIEPALGHEINVTDDVQLAMLRNDIWSLYLQGDDPVYFQGKTFNLGGGTMMRMAALKLYDAEIEALYQEVEKAMKQGEARPSSSWSGSAIEEWLLKQAVDIVFSDKLSPSVDLFKQGFDSVTFFRRCIVGAMRAPEDLRAQKATESISQDIVYKHPTIQQLAAYVAELVASSDNGSVVDVDPKAAIERMIEKYSVGLESRLTAVTSTTQPLVASVVLLTGSAGNLGSPLLASLLEDPRVQRVYAFNRAPAGTCDRASPTHH
ncbi:hypothetical protein L208DRAFT_1383230 [Tricholoma matsutake]|nr:hypothetical protein L208DRAFT_1383230 [Tricholoma matsutake 945]